MHNVLSQNIVVTGGLGFIGLNFVFKLLDLKYPNITIVDKGLSGSNLDIINDLKNYGVKIYLCSIGDPIVKSIVENSDLIFHFAACSHVDNSIVNPYPFFENNVSEYSKFLEYCRTSKSRKRIIHISTDEVYGALGPKDDPWTEESSYKPNNPYSASKAASDLLARSYVKTFGMDIIITHCCNNYGPYQNGEKFIPKIINKILNREKIPVYGNGSNIREWIFVDDHIDALILIAEKGVSGEIYNIGSDECFTNIEVVKKILKYYKLRESMIQYVNDRLGHDFRYALDSSKLRSLGWSPKVKFQDGIVKTSGWYYLNK